LKSDAFQFIIFCLDIVLPLNEVNDDVATYFQMKKFKTR
jgi:hypothetical protein